MRQPPRHITPLVTEADLERIMGGKCYGDDPELWFADTDNRYAADYAINVCRTCPVSAACLDIALRTNTDYGIWGGLTPTERRQLKKGGAA